MLSSRVNEFFHNSEYTKKHRKLKELFLDKG